METNEGEGRVWMRGGCSTYRVCVCVCVRVCFVLQAHKANIRRASVKQEKPLYQASC